MTESGTKLMDRRKLFVVSSSFFTAIFNTVALLYIARNMGVEILGAFSFILSFIGLAAFLGDMGYAHAFAKCVEKGYPFSRCFQAYRAARLKNTILMMVGANVLIVIYGMFLGTGAYIHPSAMVMILGYMVCFNLAQIWISGLVVKKRERKAKVYETVDALVKVVGIVAIVQLGISMGNDIDVFALSFVYAVAAIFGLMITFDSARRLKAKKPGDEVLLEISDTAIRYLPFVAFTALLLNIDKVLIWHWYDVTQVGLYFGGQRIVIFIAASYGAIATILGSAVVKYRDDKAKMSEALSMTERYITLMALPVTAFYIFFADDLLTHLLGAGFGSASDAVILLAVSGFFVAMTAPSLLYLLQKDRTKQLAKVTGAALAANLVIGILLIPPDIIWRWIPEVHGINGAAIAMLASSIIAFLGFRYITYRELKDRPHKRIAMHLLATAVMVVALQFMIWYFDIRMAWYIILICAPLGALFYGIMLYLTGEFLRKDFVRFKELVTRED